MFVVNPQRIMEIEARRRDSTRAVFLPFTLLSGGKINPDRAFPKKNADSLRPMRYVLSQ